PVALAAEEQKLVERRVLEGREPFVGTRRQSPQSGTGSCARAHETASPAGSPSSWRCNPSTYSSRGTSNASTPHWRQYAVTSSSSVRPTAHERKPIRASPQRRRRNTRRLQSSRSYPRKRK